MSSKTKTKTKVTPYDPASIDAASAALKSGYGQAMGTINQYSPALNSALGTIQNNIAHPPSYVTDARAQLDKTINGDYLDPASNPYASGMAKLIADKTQGEYNTTFGASGRSHGGLSALLSGQGVGNALDSFYGGIYQNERGLQQQAALAAPAFHQDQYTDTNALFSGVNGLAMMPLNAAATYSGATGNLLSPYSTQSTTQKQGFGIQQAIGLAAMIAGAASGNPMAMSAGASMAGSGGGGQMPGIVPTANSSSYGNGGLMGMGGGNGSGFIGLGGSFLG